MNERKCSSRECARVLKKAVEGSLASEGRQLTRCNQCYFAQDPKERARPGNLVYRTRNAVGALYAYAYFRRR
ncbi:hypothetical protein [Hydrogenimonas sp.]